MWTALKNLVKLSLSKKKRCKQTIVVVTTSQSWITGKKNDFLRFLRGPIKEKCIQTVGLCWTCFCLLLDEKWQVWESFQRMIEYHDKMSNSAAKKGGGFWRTSSSAIPGRPNPSNVEANREQQPNSTSSSVIQTSITAPPASSFKGKQKWRIWYSRDFPFLFPFLIRSMNHWILWF